MSSDAFFNGLAERGFEPLLQRASGTLRVDLTGGRRVEHWYLDVTRGRIAVSHRDDPAQCIVRAERSTFERIATGQSNALASMLRNEISVEGNPALVVLLQKLFPYPVHQEGPSA